MAVSQDFSVRFTADTQRFEAGSKRARTSFDRNATAIEARAGRLDNRLSRVGGAFNGRRGAILGNVSQQFQDIAVQAESGTNAVRIFAQQGPQIAGAFGPAGAVVGALIAVVGLGLSAFNAFGGSTEEAAKSLEDLGLATGGVISGITDLEDAARAYADAISATADAQVSASGDIVAQTRREFEAKKELLALEVERLRFQQDERSALIAKTELAADPRIPSRREFIDEKLAGAFTAGGQLPDRIRKDLSASFGQQFDEKFAFGDFRERIDAAEKANRELRELQANETLTDIAIERGEAALAKDFSDLASGGGRKGGSRKAAKSSDIFSAARDRILSLEREAQTVGLYGAELDRLRVAQEAARVEAELFSRAQADGGTVTQAQAAQIEAIKGRYMETANAVNELKRAEEDRLQGIKDQTKATAEMASEFSAATDQITRQIFEANSLGDALKGVGKIIANLAVRGLFGEGALGGVINQALGNSSDGAGIFSALVNADGNAFNARGVVPFAKGGIVSSPTMFGFGGGKNLGLMGEAGPEAIMPLSRGKGGKLGVVADQSVHVTVEAGPEFDVKVQQTAGAQTSAMIKQNNTARDSGFRTRFMATDAEIQKDFR